jgi:hypothetical protein
MKNWWTLEEVIAMPNSYFAWNGIEINRRFQTGSEISLEDALHEFRPPADIKELGMAISEYTGHEGEITFYVGLLGNLILNARKKSNSFYKALRVMRIANLMRRERRRNVNIIVGNA